MSVANTRQQSTARIVVLDRDGVINQDSPGYIKSADEWIPLPGSIEAIARLYAADIRVAIATNQSGLARNLFDEYALAQMHHKLCYMVEEAGGLVDGIFYCPHAPDAGCGCRKPATGLLRRIETELQVSLAGCYFIGDSDKDLQAAISHGCKPVLVRTGNGANTERGLATQSGPTVPVFDDLAQAIDQLFFSET